jgi:hypothetical protein
VQWLIHVILDTQKTEAGGYWFEPSLDKDVDSLSQNKVRARPNSTHLSFQLHGRCR